MGKKLVVLLFFLGLINALLVGCGGSEPTQQVAIPSSKTLAVNSDTTSVISATGIIVPARLAKLSFQTSGQVEELTVSTGESVHTGQALARLDDHDLAQSVKVADLQVEEAKVNLTIAQNELDRVVQWAPNKNSVAAAEAALANAQAGVKEAQAAYDKVAWLPSVSASQQSLQLEQATNNYNVAKANLSYLYSNRPDVKRAADNLELANLACEKAELNQEIAKEALQKAVLRAPFPGIITVVNIQEGEAAIGGAPAIEIMDVAQWRAETKDIGELSIDRISIGQAARVTVNAFQEEELAGTVVAISPVSIVQLGDTTYTVTIELEPTDLNLRWGMTVKVEIRLEDGD